MLTIAVFHCTAHVGAAWNCAEGLIAALTRMGHRVINAGDPRSAPAPLELVRSADLILLASAEWYAHLMWQHYGNRWRELKMPKATWYAESFHRDDQEFNFNTCRDLADRHFFPAIQDAEEFGGTWLPFGVDTEIFRPKNVPKQYEAAFLGSLYPKRIEYLKRIDYRLTYIQSVSDRDPVKSFQRLADAYSSTKIFVNLPALSRLLVTKVSEVMACGTMLITPKIDHPSGIRNMSLFEHEKHLVYYSPERPEEIAQFVRYYLAHDHEREAIAESGYEAILGTHQLESRLQTILDELAVG